jgi:hypothetical protein
LSPSAGFTVFLAVTLAFLGLTAATGLRAQRRRHIPLAVASIVSLGVTIWFAKALGKQYDLAAAGAITPIHLTLAKVATAMYLLPIGSGVCTIFFPRARRWHRRFAFLVLALTVLTAITGTLMLALAPRIG